MSGITAEVYVVQKPFTKNETIVIGRNSFLDQPSEVVLVPGDQSLAGETVKLTNIEVTGAATSSVILSKPVGVWGAETGANDKKLTISLTYSTNESGGLLGTDLVRLALERAVDAEDAIQVISNHVDKYGSDVEGTDAPIVCLLICDMNTVFLMNVIGKIWACEKVEETKYVAPGISIGTKIDKSSQGFQDKLQSYGLWNGTDELNLMKIFSISEEKNWNDMEPTSEGSFTVKNMFEILRGTDVSKAPQSSHVAISSSNGICCNWFTGTPNPKESVFKPFIFTFGARASPLTRISDGGEVPLLYKLHSQRKWEVVGSLLQSLEATCVEEVDRFLSEHPGTPNQELDDLLKDCVEAEVKFYR